MPTFLYRTFHITTKKYPWLSKPTHSFEVKDDQVFLTVRTPLLCPQSEVTEYVDESYEKICRDVQAWRDRQDPIPPITVKTEKWEPLSSSHSPRTRILYNPVEKGRRKH